MLKALPYPALLVRKNSLEIEDLNDKAQKLLGFSEDKVREITLEDIFPEKLLGSFFETLAECLEEGKTAVKRLYIKAFGEKRLVPVEVGVGEADKEHLLIILRDLTGSTEGDVEYIRNLYRVLSHINALVTSATDEKAMLQSAVDILSSCNLFEYVAIFRSEGNEPVAEAGEKRGKESSLCFPIAPGGKRTEYFLTVSRKEGIAFSPYELELLSEVAHDLAHGIGHVRMADRLKRISVEDELTGLPNRIAFIRSLSFYMKEAKRRKRPLGLVIFDIDNFGEINQAFGQETGDRIILETVARLKASVRDSDVIARTGADEFATLVTEGDIPKACAELIERLRSSFRNPIRLKSETLYVTFSAGVSVFPTDAEEAETLFTNAYSALQQAKRAGGNTTVFFTRKVANAFEVAVKIRSEARKALEKGEFTLFYQPKIDLSTKKIAGAEALIRWIKKGKVVPPMKFIPVVEGSELIHEVGQFVISEACRQIGVWKEKGINIPVAVNVSPSQLKSATFVKGISAFTDTCKGNLDLLEVEITESVIMENPPEVITFLQALSASGIKTYIDDFGTGYSSLAYLKKLPVHAIKIDREFIKDIPHSRDSLEIVKMIIRLADQLGFKTVAEGVEKEEQEEVLRDLGCDYAQGFLYSPPLPAEEFEGVVWRWI